MARWAEGAARLWLQKAAPQRVPTEKRNNPTTTKVEANRYQLGGEKPSHLWPTFPSDPLGFSQIPGHCATQCRVVVTADMVAVAVSNSESKIWVSLTPAGAHTPPAPVREETKNLKENARRALQHAVEHTRPRVDAAIRDGRGRRRSIHPWRRFLSRLSLLLWAHLASR